MIQPSLEIIKQSSEYKAAVALAGIHNAMSFKPEYFAKGICLQHRTLQQSIMRSFVATIRQMLQMITVMMTETVAHMKQLRRWSNQAYWMKSIFHSFSL